MGNLRHGEPMASEVSFITTKDGDKDHYHLWSHFSPSRNSYKVCYNKNGYIHDFKNDEEVFHSESWEETVKFIESL